MSAVDYKARYWTVARLVREAGFTSRQTYYNLAKKDPTLPKQVPGPGGRPVLIAEECEAWLEGFKR